MLRSQCHQLWRLSGIARSGQLSHLCAMLAEGDDVYHSFHGSQHSRSFAADAGDDEREISNPRVLELAGEIMQLNLLEVSDLTELLRKRLNIQAPQFGMPLGMPSLAPAAQASTESPSKLHMLRRSETGNGASSMLAGLHLQAKQAPLPQKRRRSLRCVWKGLMQPQRSKSLKKLER
jgi:Ribosomal protein L7/L12 dimerisation domain